MKNRFFRKSLAIGILLLFLVTNIVPNGKSLDTDVSNNLEYDTDINSIINESLLDLRYIYNITRDLSYIIFTEYNKSAGELAKGRNFGSKGEHKAAEILFENMTKLGLFTYKEQINNSVDTLSAEPKIASYVDILERGLTIHDLSSSTKINITNYWISPRNNFTDLEYIIRLSLMDVKYKQPMIYGILKKLIPFVLPPANGTIDKKYNLYNKERLTNNFSYKNLKVIRKPTNYSFTSDLINRIKNNEPFVYIGKDNCYSGWDEKTYYNGFIYKILTKMIPGDEKLLWTLFHPNCVGLIVFDVNNKTYNTGDGGFLPLISVNKSIGLKIFDNPDNYRIDFYINQSWNESVTSYNVIGQLNGTNPNETIIISCLYDSWWCQGTGDAAIGMAMVLGTAKYFIDHNIKPKCNIRFIGFCGEEAGLRGAYHYEASHRKENITTILDLNQLGFYPINPTSTGPCFGIASNKESLNSPLFRIANETHYTERTNNITTIRMDIREKSGGPPSNAVPFALSNYYDIKPYTTIFFAKYHYWPNHHRDGINHMEGDVLKYFYWKDVSISGELIWNITRYFVINPNCWFENDYLTSVDSPSDEDNLNDSINATFTIKTSLPQDLVMINASLIKEGRVVASKVVNYTVTSAGIQDTIKLTVPEYEEPGLYKCSLNLYNSTGMFNEILHIKNDNVNDTSPSPPEEFYCYLFPYNYEE